MTNLELLKEGNPPAELSKFQSKFRNNYDEDKQILRSGRNDSQEIFLRRADQSSGLQNLFAKFLTDTVSYLEKRFASLSCPPLSDFSDFDHRSMPVQRGERASYGNKEVQRLTEHFAPPPPPPPPPPHHRRKGGSDERVAGVEDLVGCTEGTEAY